MSAEAQSILEQALALPEAERRKIGEALLDSVAPEDEAEVREAWEQEIQRRVGQIERGEIETVDGNAGVAGIRERLRRAR